MHKNESNLNRVSITCYRNKEIGCFDLFGLYICGCHTCVPPAMVTLNISAFYTTATETVPYLDPYPLQ